MAQLSYTDNGKGEPIVFVHGLGSRKEAWKHQEPLALNHRLISVDLRGHGVTVEDENLTVKNFATDIVLLLESLGIDSAYICGLSLGGIVAQELHVQRPDMVKGLILASTTSCIPRIFTHGAIEEARKAFKSGTLLNDIVERGLVNKAYSEDARQAFHIRSSYMESAQSAIGLNYFYSLGSIKKPVLIIGSYRDDVIPWWNVWLMNMHIPHAKTLLLSSCGHLCNIEQADKFNTAVETFIEGAGTN